MRFQYLFEQAIANLRRNVLVASSAIVAVFVMLILLFGALVAQWGIHEDIGQWSENVRVIAFLGDDLSLDQIDALRGQIQQWDDVDTVTYFSKAQALDEARDLFADQPQILSVVEEDPSILPASLRIAPVQAADYSAIRDRLVVIPGVREVTSAGKAIDAQVAKANRLRTFGYWLAAVVLMSGVVLIANTIRIAIFARRDEIAIMKLVGAGNWFVRIPFLLEGLIEGVVGAIIAAALGWAVANPIAQLFSTALDPSGLTVDGSFLLLRSLFVVAFGAATGLVGSAFGMWGFLRD